MAIETAAFRQGRGALASYDAQAHTQLASFASSAGQVQGHLHLQLLGAFCLGGVILFTWPLARSSTTRPKPFTYLYERWYLSGSAASRPPKHLLTYAGVSSARNTS